MTSRLAIALAVAIIATTRPAHGEDRTPLAVQIDGCDTESEIRRVVDIELANAPHPTSDVQASVTCAGSRATLRVASGTAPPAERTVDLATESPNAHGRLIALALVELIATSRSESELSEPPSANANEDVPPREPAEPDAANGARAGQSELQSWHVLALGGALEFSSGTGLLGGGGVRVRRTASLLTIHVDAQAHHGTADVTLGRVTTDTFDAVAASGVQHTWRRVRATASVGLRGGAVRLVGSTDAMTVRSDRFWAPWLGALAIAGVEVSVGTRLAFTIELEGGVVISPVGALVGQEREIAVDGRWLGAHVGIGMIL